MNVGVAEAKNRFSELIERAENGEPVTITRHGRAVVTLHPAEARPSPVEIDAVLAEIDEAKKGLPIITTDDIIAAIHADRRY